MEDSEFFPDLNADQIDKAIDALSSYQQNIYCEFRKYCGKRKALFLAKSFPAEGGEER